MLRILIVPALLLALAPIAEAGLFRHRGCHSAPSSSPCATASAAPCATATSSSCGFAGCSGGVDPPRQWAGLWPASAGGGLAGRRRVY